MAPTIHQSTKQESNQATSIQIVNPNSDKIPPNPKDELLIMQLDQNPTNPEMNVEDFQDYFFNFCPYYWGEISKDEAEKILSDQPIGSFLLRSRDPEYQENLFAISYIDGSTYFSDKFFNSYTTKRINHGHILIFEPSFNCGTRVRINNIASDHSKNECYEGQLIHPVNRAENNNNNSLKNLAADSILKSMSKIPKEMKNLSLLKKSEGEISKLPLPELLKKDLFGHFLTEFATFSCEGILPELLPSEI